MAATKVALPDAEKLIREVQARERPSRIWVDKIDRELRKWLFELRDSYRRQIESGSQVCQTHLYAVVQGNPKTRIPVNRGTFVRWLAEPADYGKQTT